MKNVLVLAGLLAVSAAMPSLAQTIVVNMQASIPSLGDVGNMARLTAHAEYTTGGQRTWNDESCSFNPLSMPSFGCSTGVDVHPDPGTIVTVQVRGFAETTYARTGFITGFSDLLGLGWSPTLSDTYLGQQMVTLDSGQTAVAINVGPLTRQ